MVVQLRLLETPETAPRFNGRTYSTQDEQERLHSQLEAVRALMLSGRSWTINQLADALWKSGQQATHQGISARIRDLRKARFGGYKVETRRVSDGLYEYRITT